MNMAESRRHMTLFVKKICCRMNMMSSTDLVPLIDHVPTMDPTLLMD